MLSYCETCERLLCESCTLIRLIGKENTEKTYKSDKNTVTPVNGHENAIDKWKSISKKIKQQ